MSKKKEVVKKEWHKPQLYSLEFRKTYAGNPGSGADFTSTSFSATS